MSSLQSPESSRAGLVMAVDQLELAVQRLKRVFEGGDAPWLQPTLQGRARALGEKVPLVHQEQAEASESSSLPVGDDPGMSPEHGFGERLLMLRSKR